jgi:hypothetical protein
MPHETAFRRVLRHETRRITVNNASIRTRGGENRPTEVKILAVLRSALALLAKVDVPEL